MGLDYAFIHVTSVPINYGDDGFRRDVIIVSPFRTDTATAPGTVVKREYADISEASYQRLKHIKGLRQSHRVPLMYEGDMSIHAHYEVAR